MGKVVIDFHSHILPEVDDGSRSVDESLQMLDASARQGITHMAATPHFHPAESGLDNFLGCRDQALTQLRTVWHSALPHILPGAEVYYFEGMSRVERLKELRIEGTSLLLLEMPFQTWTERMVREVTALQEHPDITVLLAHIERYLGSQRKNVWDELLEAGVLMQSNASFFLRWRTRRRALRLLEVGRIHLLGSDCHNMEKRAPRMGAALAAIGENNRQELERRSCRLIGLEEAVR